MNVINGPNRSREGKGRQNELSHNGENERAKGGARLSRLGLLHEPAGYVEGQNLYQYVSGAPTSATDPLGLRRVVLNRVFLIEKVVSAKILDERQVEFTVRGSNWRVTGDVNDGRCDNPDKTRIEAKKDEEHLQTLRVKRGKNVTEDNVLRYVEEAILPELPTWYFGGSSSEVLAAAGPDSFYPIRDDPFNWTPGTRLNARRYEPPKGGGTK